MPNPAASSTVVETAAGRVAGERVGRSRRVARWLGVPFGAPPVGELRFRAPQPPSPWGGVRSATRFSPAAVQTPSLTAPRRQLGSRLDEDCLYLNVWAPAGAAGDAPGRPVFVWIHGGGFANGSGAMYDGAHLAEQGDVVVVTVNYRLGVLGFSDVTGLLPDADSNVGLRDQLAALRWVQENIAAFGGDPQRVTVGGESAGSVSAALLLTAAAGEGLFRGAVLQSGGLNLAHDAPTAARLGERVVDELGLSPASAGRLRDLPADRLLAAQQAVNLAERDGVAAAPWFDGDLVPASLDAARSATRPSVALLAGHNRNEITLFRRLYPGILPTERDALERVVRAHHPDADAVLRHYARDRAGTTDLGTDVTFAVGTRELARRHAAAGGATWFYRLDAPVPVLGTTHAADLAYLWAWRGTSAALRGLPTPGRRALGRRLRTHWLSFVRDLRPGPDWASFDAEQQAIRVLTPGGDRTDLDPFAARVRAWAGREVPTLV